ncbi:hypothetical protein [Pseudomonas sp. S36]|uniref:hypothetical protein n=1 Tax=Pseudomonas sp. S36 TaxID=2767447 RepID=UPI001913C425|nr:hypothetical protein [Pseudomonas sp. S36]MBK4987248.1 hypothetical protein [Pseudomonas sp. S36]
MRKNPRLAKTLFGMSLTALVSATGASAAPQAGAQAEDTGAPVSPLTGFLNQRGRESVDQLKTWYDAVADDCGGPSKPAYLCSGIHVRTTTTSTQFLPWEPTQSQLTKGSVAFSWLRQDNNFGKPFGNQNGLILPPVQAVPPGKNNKLEVLCSFPINANTNQRTSLQGCGPITGYETTTASCQTLGVSTAQQWLERYPNAGNYRVCGWDMREPSQPPAKAFQTAIQARAGLADALWHVNNEVLLPVWSAGSGGELPIQAFFFVSGEPQALVKAQFDQIRYYQAYQQLVPVVSLAFPSAKGGVMTFGYDADGQAVGRPTPLPDIDFEHLAVGDVAKVTVDEVVFEMGPRRQGVSDAAHDSGGLIAGKHLQADGTITFSLPGAGRRLVSFSWGSNSYTGLGLSISGEQIELSEDDAGPMRYGRQELIIEGPEVFTLTVDSTEDDSLLVLDNLKVEKLPDHPLAPSAR